MAKPVMEYKIGDLKVLDQDYFEGFNLCLDSQDIKAALEHVPDANLLDIHTDAVTGVLEYPIDADTLETWVTVFSRPFEVTAIYQRVL